MSEPAENASPGLTAARVRWTRTLEAEVLHLAMARESARLYAIDASHTLHAWSCDGEPSRPQTLPDLALSLSASDDGRRVLVLCEGGLIMVFDHDLAPRTARAAGHNARVAAVDAFGDRFAVVDDQHQGQLIDRYDRRLARFQTPTPVHQLRFVPERAVLLGLSNRGQLIAIDYAGQTLWTQSFGCSVAACDSSGDGAVVLVSCLNRGVTRCDGAGAIVGSYILDGSVTDVATNWEASLFLAANSDGRLFLVDRLGRVLDSGELGRRPVGLGLDATGRRAAYATDGGHVTMLELGRPRDASGDT